MRFLKTFLKHFKKLAKPFLQIKIFDSNFVKLTRKFKSNLKDITRKIDSDFKKTRETKGNFGIIFQKSWDHL